MKDKGLEKIIKDNIKLNFKDDTSKLREYNNYIKNARKNRFRFCVSLCSVFLIISMFFCHNNAVFKDKTPNIYTNILNVNDINYQDDNEDIKLGLITESGISIDLENLPEVFNSNLKLDMTKVKNISCRYDSSGEELKQCNIVYNVNDDYIYINVKKNKYPTFTTEVKDYWKENIMYRNFKLSEIKGKQMIIIRNLDSRKYMAHYYNQDASNFRTKFMIDDIGISFESYSLSLDLFALSIAEIIS